MSYPYTIKMKEVNNKELEKFLDRVQNIPFESFEYKEIKRTIKKLKKALN